MLNENRFLGTFRGHNTRTNISLPALGTSHDDNEGGEHKHVIVESKTDTPTTLLRGETTATLVT